MNSYYSIFFNLLLLNCILLSKELIAENNGQDNTKSKKGSVYFYWGYNRAFFSKSTIHFTGQNYDFTLYDLEAKDRPEKFSGDYFRFSTFSIAQYNYRLGYFLTDRLAISGGLDHMKYVVVPHQPTYITGSVLKNASSDYAGNYSHRPIVLKEEVLQFEHTNGFNLAGLEIDYFLPFKYFSSNWFSMRWNCGGGMALMVMKTDVHVFLDGLDNDFNIAGYAASFKTGPRFEFSNRFFISAEVKTGYVQLPWVHIKNEAPERANHNVGFIEFYSVAGVYVNFRKRRE